jgi:PAS domain S-box-containing protein
MATSPDRISQDLTEKPQVELCQLSRVQTAAIRQIAGIVRGTVALDEALQAIARQLREALGVSGCLIFLPERFQQPIAAVGDAALLYPKRLLSQLYQETKAWLPRGEAVRFPECQHFLSPKLRQWAIDSNLGAIWLEPIGLDRDCDGGVMLYQWGQAREWTPQQMDCIKAIADGCAIAWHQGARVPQEREASPAREAERQQQLHAIYHQTSQWMGMLTPEGTILEVNQALLDFTGLQASNILGHQFWQGQWWAFSPETHQQLQAAIAAAAAGECIRYEVDCLGAKERVATFDITLKPLRDEMGNAIALMFEGRDITDYKQAQVALQVSAARNRAFLDAIPDAIFRISRHGIYLEWQGSNTRALPVADNEIVGKHLHQILPTDVAGLIWECIEQALETYQIQIAEYQLWFDGKPHYFEARIATSGVDEVAMVVQDVTERVEARLILQQVNDALESRVEQRTAALQAANHALRAEIVERHRAEQQ